MPDNYATEYLEAIQKARRDVLTASGVPKRANEALMRVYAQMLKDITRDLSNESITSDRAEVLERKIIKRFNELAIRTGNLFDQAKRSAIDRVIKGHQEAIERAATAADISGISVSFNGVPQQALELMMLRRGLNAKNYKSVINRGLRSAAGDIEQYIASAVGRGVSARRASQELAGILSRNNEAVLNLLNDSRLTKSAINGALKTGGISASEFKEANKILFDARRIMVTETNTAFREADIISQQRSPVVGGSKWQLSGRHAGLPSSPDVCDVFSESDQFGLGEGVYPSENVPSTPHPFCGCYTTSVIRSPDKWNEPSIAAQQPAMLQESNFAIMFEGKTPRHLEVQIQQANYYQQLAYQIATGAGSAAA